MTKPCATHSCLQCPMRENTEWANLTTDELTFLDKHKVEKQYSLGDTLFHQGDENNGVYCIHTGLLGLRRLDSMGNSVLVRMAHPGDTVGYRSFLQKGSHTHSAEILAPSNVCTIKRSAICHLLGSNPDLGFRFLASALSDLEAVEEKLVQCRTWPAKARLLHTLLIFNERIGAQTEMGHHKLELPVSRRELAAIIGTTPEAMSRLVSQVQEEGIVQISGRTVIIPQVEHVLNILPDLV